MSQKSSPSTTFNSILQVAGLNEKEATVYSTLLEYGALSASKIAALGKLKRGITYAALAKLVVLGIISESVVSGVSIFIPSHPSTVLSLIESKRGELSSMEELLKQKMPELSKKYKIGVGRPTVQYYEGEDGIFELFDDIYAPKNEPVYGCVDVEVADTTFPQHIKKYLIPKRIKNGIQAISILADSTTSRELAKQDVRQLRISALVSKDKYPLPAEVDVYEDKVSFMTFAKGEFVAIRIENAPIAQTMRSLLRLAHREARKGMK